MESSNNKISTTQNIHSTWIPLLQTLYWEGKLNIFLSKGFVFLQLTEEEKKRWKLNTAEINRIEEILQENIETFGRENPELKRKILSILAVTDHIEIPNKLVNEDRSLFDELIRVSSEIRTDILEETKEFVSLIKNSNFNELCFSYVNWSRKNHFPAMKISASKIAESMKEEGIPFPFLRMDEWVKLPLEICPYILLVHFYYDSELTKNKISVYKNLLLKKNENLTAILDFIVFSSWRLHPNRMFSYTKEWIETGNPYLIDWLIHGVEVPGRSQPTKALRFLKPTLLIDNKNVEWILKHVVAQIIGASPYESLTIFSNWLNDIKFRENAQRILRKALAEVIEDKIERGNLMDEDYPELKKTIQSILENWLEKGNEHQFQVAKDALQII